MSRLLPAPRMSLLLAAYKEAQKHLRKIVGPFDEKDHGDELERWVSFIEHHALAVLLYLGSRGVGQAP